MVSQSTVTWEVAADLKGYERFFPIPTTKKPDLVIWSEELKEVHLVELTVPHEDNISSAHERKENRYEALVGECEEAGWKAMHFPVEVGCRGYIATSITKWMRVAGLVMGHVSSDCLTCVCRLCTETRGCVLWAIYQVTV